MTPATLAFLLTFLAGISTGIGSLIAFLSKQQNIRFLSTALGFSAGVMIYVSLVELLPESKELLLRPFGTGMGVWIALLSFFAGIAFIALIDFLVPNDENPHHLYHQIEDEKTAQALRRSKRLYKAGFMTALAIAIHNFPEGFATFISTLQNPSVGFSIALAIAIHNIPEGIAVSVPIYFATKSKKKAFWFSFASGLSEPFGALLGYFLLSPFMGDALLGIVFAFVAGIMVFIALDELLPAARDYGEHALSIYGLIAGMLLIAVTLALFS